MFFIFHSIYGLVVFISCILFGVLAYLEAKLYVDSNPGMDILDYLPESCISFFIVSVLNMVYLVVNDGLADAFPFVTYFARMIVVHFLYRRKFFDSFNKGKATSAFVFTEIKLLLILGAVDVVFVVFRTAIMVA